MKAERSGSVPLAVVLITRNEAHQLPGVFENLRGFAQEIFVVDSYSTDETVDIALRNRAHVVQRPFRSFGHQWNYALSRLPITAPWTMKLDPDERLNDELKDALRTSFKRNDADGLIVRNRLWFMNRPLHVKLAQLRIWRTGTCQFSKVSIGEHPMVSGRLLTLQGELEHHDSPHLHHWVEKQNHYTTAEALARFTRARLSKKPRLLGSPLERRMWMKANFHRFPFRHTVLMLYHLFVLGAWRSGISGLNWCRLRVEVYRMIDLKVREMERLERPYPLPPVAMGVPHPGARQAGE